MQAMAGFNVPLYPSCNYVVGKLTAEHPARGVVPSSDSCAVSFANAERQHEFALRRGHDGRCHCWCAVEKRIDYSQDGSHRALLWLASMLLGIVCGLALASLSS